MRVGVLTSSYNLSIDRKELTPLVEIIHELKKRKHELVHLDIDKAKWNGADLVYDNVSPENPIDSFICWWPGYARYQDLADYAPKGGASYFDQIKWLSERYPSTTSYEAVLTTNNKLKMSETFKNAGLPIPQTWDGENPENRALIVADLLAHPEKTYVAKPNYGWAGVGVVKFSGVTDALAAFQKFDQDKSPFILQEFIDGQGIDYRAYVIGDQVVGSIKRTAKEGEWRGNGYQGSTASAFNFTAQQKKDAVTALRSAGLTDGAVDILMDIQTGQHYICEINDGAGTDNIEAATPGLSLIKKIADHLEKITQDHKNSKTALPPPEQGM